MDYVIKNKWSIQLAPNYIWLVKWNEYYLTFPLHLRKSLGDKISVYAGPALTYDIGYFKDLGISVGLYYHLGNKSSINLSFLTFTLYYYHIDYIFVPIGLTYSFMILKQ